MSVCKTKNTREVWNERAVVDIVSECSTPERWARYYKHRMTSNKPALPPPAYMVYRILLLTSSTS